MTLRCLALLLALAVLGSVHAVPLAVDCDSRCAAAEAVPCEDACAAALLCAAACSSGDAACAASCITDFGMGSDSAVDLHYACFLCRGRAARGCGAWSRSAGRG